MIFILGTVGNAVVCIAILKRKGLQNSCNMFTFNLAFHDLILVIVYVPTQMIVFENCYHWVVGGFMCYLVYTILPLSFSVSIGTLMAITADRYRAIVFPVRAKLSRKTVKLIVAAIWVVSVVTALPLVFVMTIFSPYPGIEYCMEAWPSPIASEAYWVSMFVFQYLLPLCIIAVLASITAYTLRKNSLPVAMETCAQSEVFRKTLKKRAKQTQRITNMLIALVLLYAICMLPQHVVYTFWARYGDLSGTSYREMAYTIANIFPIANSALNAIAYGTLYKEFKVVFNRLFSCACCKMNAPRNIFRRQTVTRTEMPSKSNKRSAPLLQEWKSGRETMTSPLLERKQMEIKDSIRGYSYNQGNNLPANHGQTCLLAVGGVDLNGTRQNSLQHLGSDDKEMIFKKETAV